MDTVALPIFTDTIDQTFFIESQGGSQHPISYLDRFADKVYTKAIDSTLVHLLYALMGPAGVGSLRQAFLEARLQFEEAGLSTVDLDAAYTNPFAFARLAEETYEIDASAALLSSLDRARVLANDAAFRNRATGFLKGIRAGGTPKGVRLVAQSGLNHPVDVVENYKALYDQYCDTPLNLPYVGSSTKLNEIIVLPRQDVPRSGQQTLVIDGQPTSGWFTLTYPRGPNYQLIRVGVTNGSNVITVPDASQVSPGAYVSITNATGSSVGTAIPAIYAQTSQVQSLTSIALVHPPQGTTPGQPYNMTLATNTYWAFVGNAQTVPLPYNVTNGNLQTALWNLPVVGRGNIRVTGGPLPNQPVIIQFEHALGDIEVAPLLGNVAPDVITGIGGPSSIAPLVSQMTDVTNNPLSVDTTITVDVAGVSADNQITDIAPADRHAMQVALDEIRPITSFVTTAPGRSVTRRQPSNTIFTGANYTEVLRYATGNSHIHWPARDTLHWVEEGKEHEAPRPVNRLQHHYQGFHSVANIYAYNEQALADPFYENPAGGPAQPLWVRFFDTLIGVFSPAQVALYPMLGNYTDSNRQFNAPEALAPIPDPLVITDTVADTGIINQTYPADYIGLSGIPQQATALTFWASAERADGTDYLEIDLGTPQAVNYVYFEATSKPYLISVDYDVLDLTPQRHFIPVTLVPSAIAPSITNLSYSAAATNPWTTVVLNFTNSLEQMIFTRYIRLGFTRNPGSTPLMPNPHTVLPYSIEIRNLRIGRNTVTAGASSHAFSRAHQQATTSTPPPFLLNPSVMIGP